MRLVAKHGLAGTARVLRAPAGETDAPFWTAVTVGGVYRAELPLQRDGGRRGKWPRHIKKILPPDGNPLSTGPASPVEGGPLAPTPRLLTG